MKRLSLSFIILVSLGAISLEAFDYKVSGRAESFSKVGFNNTPIDSNKGKYPTESFVTMVGALQIDMEVLNSQDQSLRAGLGGMIGGLAYDSTRNLIDVNGEKFGSVGYNYIGYWGRYYGDAPWGGNTGFSDNTRNYVLYNAYLDYEYSGIFGIKAGRYESEAEFHSSYTQGFQAYVKFSDFKLWWFSSYGRAFAYDQWLYDFYAPKVVVDSKGKSVNYGIHAFYATYSHKGLLVSPFLYFSPKTHIAPSLKLQYDTKPDFKGVGFRSKTTVYGLFPILDERVVGTNRYGNPAPKTAQTLIVKQHFDLDNYNVGGGLYINFGNANAHFGTYGNPVGIDFWAASAYDIGPSMSDMMGKNARTGFLYGGGKHGDFSWGMLGRITFSDRSDEQSIAVNVAYSFPNNIAAGLKLEYFNDITKAGYKVGESKQVPGQPKDISDRSHMMAFLRHNF